MDALTLVNQQVVDGATFAFDAPESAVPVWGAEGEVLAAAGEPTLIVGPQGVGKTTLMQQFILARAGIRTAPLLGLPVQVDPRPVLYVAADRPMQARRSFRRMVTEEDRQGLRERIIFWSGPLPFDIAREPEELAKLATDLGVGTVVLDSLKDLAVDLVKDEIGTRVNRALQLVVGEGIEVVAAHHQRKSSADNRRPRKLDDVYGSVWLTAGCGSVVLLWGNAGDPVVELVHLKQPSAEVGPLKVAIDHEVGQFSLFESADALSILRAAGSLSAPTMAARFFGTSSPSDAEIAKARRKLERLAERGLAVVEDAGGARDSQGRRAPRNLPFRPAPRGDVVVKSQRRNPTTVDDAPDPTTDQRHPTTRNAFPQVRATTVPTTPNDTQSNDVRVPLCKGTNVGGEGEEEPKAPVGREEPESGWQLFPRYIRLTCPACRVSVDVVQGATAWCTRCPNRPEMEGSAT